MSRVSGSKRKAPENKVQNGDADSEQATVDNDESMTQLIDREIEREIAAIKSGTHPNLLHSATALEHAKQKKIDASDRHRKAQIKNINALYEYEVEDATSLYNKAYVEVQEELIFELQSERNRQRLAAVEQEKTRQKRSANGTSDAANAAAAAAAGATGAGGRSLRSSAPAGETDAPSGPNGASNAYSRDFQYGRAAGATVDGSKTSAAANSSSSGARRRTGLPSQGLDYALPESTMRADFVDIVRDLHSRAAAFEKTKSKALDKEVKISGDLSELYVGDECYSAGDLVVVFSTLSQENISGIITSLTHSEIVIRTPTGPRFRVLVGQLRSGRVVLSKDKETLNNAVMFRTAAEMQLAQDKYYK